MGASAPIALGFNMFERKAKIVAGHLHLQRGFSESECQSVLIQVRYGGDRENHKGRDKSPYLFA